MKSILLLIEKWHDKLHGGEADKKKPSDFDPEQLKIGIKSEMEHTNDKHIAAEIAMDHLKEDPNYYEKLSKIEKESRENKMKLPKLNEVFVAKEAWPQDDMKDAEGQPMGQNPYGVYGPKADDDKRKNMDKAKQSGKRFDTLQKRRANTAAKKGTAPKEPQQMDLPGMKDVFSSKPQSKAAFAKQNDGRPALDQVKGKFVHVPQDSGLERGFSKDAGYTWETMPGKIAKQLKPDDKQKAAWGHATYRIEDDGSFKMVDSNWDSSG